MLRAQARCQLEDFEEALIDLNEALMLNPQSIEVFAERARIYSQFLKMNKLASKDIEKFNKLWSKNSAAYEQDVNMQKLKQLMDKINQTIIDK